ncbi:alpha/beta hydrolase [Serratia sp. PAMC26656]|uniref:alpha/beta hydrolase n=1 Tax=Serratia sp. PAMC26656 TaxID=2775909 RepID=UPI0018F5E49F|nr:alpha/beta hydrolase [Serratia sp. PAMC26656]MBJ7891777.1 alpha/beta hydrolase [Serratia sp. PAMC26656]
MSREQRKKLNAKFGLPNPNADTARSIEQIRAGFAALMGTMQVPEGTTMTTTQLGSQRTLVIEACEQKKEGIILYFHGGSGSIGSPETAMSLTSSLVVRTGLTAYSLDYRLAPENPFPAGLEDCTAAYRELLEQGINPKSIVFAGDSAGGGLCVTTCLNARKQGLPLPGALVTFSAGFDATRSGESVDTKDGIDPFFTKAEFRNPNGFFSMYIGQSDPHQELLSPVLYADLHGFPPMLLQVGTNELLLDDSTRMAKRARDAEVDVILDVTADVPHVFQAFTGKLEEADFALDRAAMFITQQICRSVKK